jgi:excisionase family DNA binding protein
MRVKRTSPAASAQDPKPAASPGGYLFTSEVAELLSVSPKTVSRWAKEGKLPFRRTLGGHRRFPESKIRELRDSLQVS